MGNSYTQRHSTTQTSFLSSFCAPSLPTSLLLSLTSSLRYVPSQWQWIPQSQPESWGACFEKLHMKKKKGGTARLGRKGLCTLIILSTNMSRCFMGLVGQGGAKVSQIWRNATGDGKGHQVSLEPLCYLDQETPVGNTALCTGTFPSLYYLDAPSFRMQAWPGITMQHGEKLYPQEL